MFTLVSCRWRGNKDEKLTAIDVVGDDLFLQALVPGRLALRLERRAGVESATRVDGFLQRVALPAENVVGVVAVARPANTDLSVPPLPSSWSPPGFALISRYPPHQRICGQASGKGGPSYPSPCDQTNGCEPSVGQSDCGKRPVSQMDSSIICGTCTGCVAGHPL